MIILNGISVVTGKFKGIARKILNPKGEQIKNNEILVTDFTSPEFTMLMFNCGAILTERGGSLSHTAILARELNKISVVRVKDLIKFVEEGDVIEIDGNKIKIYK